MIRAQTCLRYYVESNGDPVEHDFNILVINYADMIMTIAQRIKWCLAPIISYRDVIKFGDIPGERLNYRLIKLVSGRNDIRSIDWGEIYNGSVREDKDLRNRKSNDGLKEYVEKQFGF